MDGIDSRGLGSQGVGVGCRMTPGNFLFTKSTWNLGIWDDILPSCWLRSHLRFSVERLLRNTDWRCVWLSLDEAFLSLFTVSLDYISLPKIGAPLSSEQAVLL